MKLFLFAYDIIISVGNPKKAVKRPVKLVIEFSKMAGYDTNIRKSVSILYQRTCGN